jgi:hypothetical protein
MGEFKRQAAKATEQAVSQAAGAQQMELARASAAMTGGSPIAPGGLAQAAQGISRETGKTVAAGTSEAQKLASAVREKRKAQALGAAERLQKERYAKGMDVASIAYKAATIGAGGGKAAENLGLIN